MSSPTSHSRPDLMVTSRPPRSSVSSKTRPLPKGDVRRRKVGDAAGVGGSRVSGGPGARTRTPSLTHENPGDRGGNSTVPYDSGRVVHDRSLYWSVSLTGIRYECTRRALWSCRQWARTNETPARDAPLTEGPDVCRPRVVPDNRRPVGLPGSLGRAP